MAIVETKIDRFVNEVVKKGKLTFSEASKILDVPIEKVKEWAYILDKHKEETGIEVYYPTVGEPEIVSIISRKKTEISKRISSLSERKEKLKETVEISTKKSERAISLPVPEKELVTELTSKLAKKVEELEKFEKDIGAVREKLEKVEKRVEMAEEEGESLLNKLKEDKGKLEKTKDELATILKKLDAHLNRAEELSGAISHIKKAKKEVPMEIKKLKSEIKELEEEIKKLEELSKKVTKEGISKKIKELLKFK